MRKLVLAVTAAKPNGILMDAMGTWFQYAKRGEHLALMADSAKRMYTDAYLKRYSGVISLTAAMSKPKSYERFEIMANACMNHDAYEGLEGIDAQTLVIGGGKDKALGVEPSKEIASRIPHCNIKVFEEYGHAVYEEAKDFNDEIYHFLIG